MLQLDTWYTSAESYARFVCRKAVHVSVTAFLQQITAQLKTGQATEHSFRPALAQLFTSVLPQIEAINEPKHAQYGAPDFVIQRGHTPIGHVEAKDVDIDLEQAIADSEKPQPKTSNGKQLKRYRAALPNLLYTDGLAWHWFVDGQPRLMLPTVIGVWNPKTKQLKVSTTATHDLTTLLQQFATQTTHTVTTPQDLAQRLAQIARWLDEVINQVFAKEDGTGSLHRQLQAFRDALLPNLAPAEFADMYAQTLVYGLFAARVAQPQNQQFSRLTAWHFIPKTNPFLRRMFQEVTAEDLDPQVAWLVDDCARLLAHTDMSSVMADFGTATQQQDPVVHFYETFLQAYDPKLRETRGVYYTPEPVVSYLVRSVDTLLQTHFNKPMGLADDQTIILDPATGTGTFLHVVVQQIHADLVNQGLAGMWNEYVPKRLLPRLFGFELLMAPYTVAHLKLGLLLSELGYQFGTQERLGVYLTNTIADVPTQQVAFAFAQAIAEEGTQANRVKQSEPVMVVIGNPPYSGHSANKGEWITDLLKGKFEGHRVSSYYEVDGAPLSERNPSWLQDDYVKFIRFGQWRINRSGAGILAIITNNGYLDNPTFRGMRQSLLHEFDTIYILNLHGNSKKRERAPDGGPDENVFDIQQGVAIALFVKSGQPHSSAANIIPTTSKVLPHTLELALPETSAAHATVYYADVWGMREDKYAMLNDHDVQLTNWQMLRPSTPFYLFVPQQLDTNLIINQGWSTSAIFPVNGWGVKTRKDYLLVDFSRNVLIDRFHDIASLPASTAISKYEIKQSPHWSFEEAKKLITGDVRDSIKPILFRPFDTRFVYYEKFMIERGDHRWGLMSHMLLPNISLITIRRSEVAGVPHDYFCGDGLSVLHSISAKEVNFVCPLYLYPRTGERQASLLDNEGGTSFDGRQPNLSPQFTADVSAKLHLQFVPDGNGDLQHTWGPEDIFHYAYAIFHSPTYRSHYAEFLKIDFPRLPLTSDRTLFAALVAHGAQLVDLHLLRLPESYGVGGAGGAAILVSPGKQGVSYPLIGTNVVGQVKYYPPLDGAEGYVRINETQRFVGIDPDTWAMQIGGYQPLEKWLKDRKGRTLTTEDVQHYLRMIIALRETRRIMDAIDQLIPGWPLL